jgi:hypothetical protein
MRWANIRANDYRANHECTDADVEANKCSNDPLANNILANFGDTSGVLNKCANILRIYLIENCTFHPFRLTFPFSLPSILSLPQNRK